MITITNVHDLVIEINLNKDERNTSLNFIGDNGLSLARL